MKVEDMGHVVDPKTGTSQLVWNQRVSGRTSKEGVVGFAAKRVNPPPDAPRALRWRAEPPRQREDLLLTGRGGTLAIRSMTVRLPRGFVVAGTVTDALGAPLAGLVVQYATGADYHATTDVRGRFRFRPLPKAGRTPWRLWVRSPTVPDTMIPHVRENGFEAWGGEEHLELVVAPLASRPGFYRPARER